MRETIIVLVGLIVSGLMLVIGRWAGARKRETEIRREVSISTRAAAAELAVRTVAIERSADERTKRRIQQIRAIAQDRLHAGGDAESLEDLLAEVDELWSTRGPE